MNLGLVIGGVILLIAGVTGLFFAIIPQNRALAASLGTISLVIGIILLILGVLA